MIWQKIRGTHELKEGDGVEMMYIQYLSRNSQKINVKEEKYFSEQLQINTYILKTILIKCFLVHVEQDMRSLQRTVRKFLFNCWWKKIHGFEAHCLFQVYKAYKLFHHFSILLGSGSHSDYLNIHEKYYEIRIIDCLVRNQST